MPNDGLARSLVVDAGGRVWTGGADEIALLAPDAHGVLTAVSQLPRVPENARAFGLVTFAAAASDAVYFATATRLFRFALDDRSSARAWPLPQPVVSLFLLDGILHCGTADGALLALDAATGSFTPVLPPSSDSPASTRASRTRILAAQLAPDGSALLLTSRGPVRRVAPGAPLLPLAPDATEFFAAEPAESAAFLSDGRMAFGRILGGVAVFDPAGKLVQKIDRAHGLLGNRVEQLCEDAEGGLWVAQRTGLTRVQLDSPYARHTVAQGIDGRPRALHRHEGRLYVAHNEGAAWRDDTTGQFHALGGLTIGLTRFCSVGPRLLATTNALYEVTPEKATPLIRQPFTPLLPLAVPGSAQPWLLGGGPTGASLLAPAGNTWRPVGALAHLPADLASLVRTPDGFVWGMSNDGRIWRIDFRAGPTLDAPVALYGPAQGVPRVRRRDAELFLLGSEVLATSSAWILRYDPAADRFVPESRIAGLPADTGVTRASADADGTLWLQLAEPSVQLFRIQPAGPAAWRAEPLTSPAVSGLVANRLYHDDAARTLWIASQGALVSLDLTWKETRPRPLPAAHVRRVETSNRELIFGGSADRSLNPKLSTLNSPSPLNSSQNTLRFTFAAPVFDGDFLGRAQTVYRTRLDGLESDWTPWSPDTVREFSNLPFRALTFRVEARGPDGRSGPAAAWAFVLAPPWWLTPWAFASYVLAALAAFVALVRWRTQRLRRRAAHLETVVATRTEQLRRSNEELARLHALERDEKLAARIDEEKARLEMLRYQLNPHFLYNTLASICGTARTNPDATRTMAQRLADFCRLTLTRSDEMDTVHEEVRMLRSYLEIEQARWRDQLEVTIDVAPAARDRRLPTFLLLPLVENAIKHGGRTTRGVLRIRIAISITSAMATDVGRLAEGPSTGQLTSTATPQDTLLIEVANTGVWEPVTAHPDSTGIGLENLRRRLRRYYPGAHEFSIEQEGDWVVAKLALSHGQLPIQQRRAIL